MEKIVVLDGRATNPGDLSWAGLEQFGKVTVYDRSFGDEVVQHIGDARIVFTNKTLLTKEVLNACPNLRYIGVLATGYNVVDTEEAKKLEIIVSNVPAYSTVSVAQFVFALLLEICHRVGHHSDAVHAGRWSTSVDFCFWDYPLIELASKTIGIIGYGQIGRAVARLAQAFGMKVMVYSRSTQPGTEQDGVRFEALDEVLSQSDVVSLHCPLTEATQGMINKDSIEKMKPEAILINTGRGPLVVEQDLADALNSGRLYAAGLDVASQEPLPADSPLIGAKNCFITPHIAWAPREARQRLLDIAADNLNGFLNGKPVNVVNPFS
jgi:glycerate dehydrogenase